KAAEVGHLLVTNPLDVGYLTGFLGGESYLLVPESGRPVVISDFRYEEELEPVKPIADVYIRKTGMLPATAEVIRSAGVRRCGVQAEHMNLADFRALGELLGGAKDGAGLAKGGRVELVTTSGLVGKLRAIKDEHEIALMRKATRIQEAALVAVIPTLRRGKGAGKTELEIAARLEAEMKSRGSSQPGFQSIIAAKANGSLPHYRPGPVKAAKDRPLLVDWGATYQGYQSDMTRTFTLGKWPRKIAEIYQIVLEAQEMAAAALAPGKTTHEIDAVARVHITRHGYGQEFGHGLGHGLGLSKDPPYLNPMVPMITLEVGHVCTVEPGIYLPGIGGVRIEDLYVIRPGGAENLCKMRKDMEWATL
ncbi:MAG: M24 family metallopeptidase, partial [Phycisphaerales bacterium]